MTRKLRSWLQIEPHPVRVRMVDAEGDTHVIRIGESKSRWRDAENALSAAVKCTALDKDGEILRVWENDEALAAVPQTANEGAAARTELSELARIITESNDAAVGRLVEILRVNLEQNATLVNVLSERNRQLEYAWQDLLRKQAKQMAAIEPDAEGDDNTKMIMGLLATQAPQLLATLMGGNSQDPPPPNGAKKS